MIENQVTLIGRLTKDPDERFTADGTAVTRFTLAVDRHRSDEADFINIVCFKATAENVARYLKKGREAAIAGRIKTGSYKNKDGQTVYTTEVIADYVKFLGRKEEQAAEPAVDLPPDDFKQIEADIPF